MIKGFGDFELLPCIENDLYIQMQLRKIDFKYKWNWRNNYTSISKSNNERRTKYRDIYASGGGYRVEVNGTIDYKGCVWCGELKCGSLN